MLGLAIATMVWSMKVMATAKSMAARARFFDFGGGARPCRIPVSRRCWSRAAPWLPSHAQAWLRPNVPAPTRSRRRVLASVRIVQRERSCGCRCRMSRQGDCRTAWGYWTHDAWSPPSTARSAPAAAGLVLALVLLLTVSCTSQPPTDAGPDQQIAAFISVWQQLHPEAAADLTSDPAAAAVMLGEVTNNLHPDSLTITAGEVNRTGPDTATHHRNVQLGTARRRNLDLPGDLDLAARVVERRLAAGLVAHRRPSQAGGAADPGHPDGRPGTRACWSTATTIRSRRRSGSTRWCCCPARCPTSQPPRPLSPRSWRRWIPPSPPTGSSPGAAAAAVAAGRPLPATDRGHGRAQADRRRQTSAELLRRHRRLAGSRSALPVDPATVGLHGDQPARARLPEGQGAAGRRPRAELPVRGAEPAADPGLRHARCWRRSRRSSPIGCAAPTAGR